MKRFPPILAAALAVVFLAAASGPAAAAEKCGRYQIVKATENTVWRLDTESGDIAACRYVNDVMTCGSSETAVTRPKASYEDLKAERKRERAERREEDIVFMDRMLDLFKKLIAMVRDFAAEMPPVAQ